MRVMGVKPARLPVAESRDLLRDGGQALILARRTDVYPAQTKENKLILAE
jgi:hypothetical protein